MQTLGGRHAFGCASASAHAHAIASAHAPVAGLTVQLQGCQTVPNVLLFARADANVRAFAAANDPAFAAANEPVLMELAGVLEHLSPIVGLSSAIGAPESVSGAGLTGIPTLEQAKARLSHFQERQDTCTSDYAYWGYAGQVSFWKVVVNLLDAAALVGPEHLPDVPLPARDGVVMDNMAALERFGAEVLRRAEEAQR